MLIFPYAFAQTPFGALSDRIGTRKVIILCVFLYSIMALFTGLATDFIQLLFFRILTGFADGGHYAPSSAWLSEYFPSSERGKAFGIYMSAIPLSAVVALVVVPSIGWRLPFFLSAIPGFILVILLLLIKEPKNHTGGNLKKPRQGGGNSRIFINAPLVKLALGYALVLLSVFGFITFLPSYINARYSVSVAVAGLFSSLYYCFWLIGGPAGGILTDKMNSKRLWLTYLSITAVMLFFLSVIQNPAVLIISLVLLGFCRGTQSPLLMDHTASLSPPEAIGFTFGFVNTISFIGSALGPIIAGYIIDTLGYEIAFSILAVVMIMPLILIVSLPKPNKSKTD
jgi:MFS family permease